MPREFKIISTQLIHETPRFAFKLVQGETDGKVQTFCRLERPVVVFVVPLSPTGRTVILRQFRFPVEKELWEFPAGHTEPGEDHAQSARRELQEETSLQTDHVELIGQFYGMPSSSSSMYKIYVAKVTDEQLNQIKPPEAEDEITNVQVVPLAQVTQMIARGEWESGTSMATYALVQAYLDQKVGYG